ncbi:DUF2515 family protein [Longirhabdus pacifica]|uniref:DUF2515 family protein n=1 Tax=Longirhabdus pacifica TaxID=2305227 RepID=UPI0010090C59|nr:DUF2515 family protein [Longirhabdus pacifica]
MFPLSYLHHRWKQLTWSLTLSSKRNSLSLNTRRIACIQNELSEVEQKVLPQQQLEHECLQHELIQHIKDTTVKQNVNNVTRTMAYKRIYDQHPELHWAYLAHMVSRNAGWSMTDLRGECLPHLITSVSRKHIFTFLETANALIFQDAYPQLLLYHYSRQREENLFHLLPSFHISTFMKPFWDDFWERKDSMLLTVALVINEQHYIEERVVQDPFFKVHVLETLPFKIQSILQFNQVIFPYAIGPSQHRVCGLTLEQFSNINERIEFGKSLYFILFYYPEVHKRCALFSDEIQHSGSRSDYWPTLFQSTMVQSERNLNLLLYEKKMNRGKLINKNKKLYSPPLHEAWDNMRLPKIRRFDWFPKANPWHYFKSIKRPKMLDMTHDHSLMFSALELSVLAGEKIGILNDDQ